jgi:hypothetical protein
VYDVSVVEVSHEDEAGEGEHEGDQLLAVRAPLRVVQHRPGVNVLIFDKYFRREKWSLLMQNTAAYYSQKSIITLVNNFFAQNW